MNKFSNVNELSNWMRDNGFNNVFSAGLWSMSSCPFHKDKNPSFGINLETLKGHCFACGWFEWEEILEHLGIPIEAIDKIDAITGIAWRALKDQFYTKEKRSVESSGIGIDRVELKSNFINYLKKRNLWDLDLVKEFKFKACINGRFRDRIILPVYDKANKEIFFDARAISSNVKPKYLRPVNSPVEISLGGIQKVIKEKRNKLIICEGYLDMFHSWIMGFPAVSVFGANLHLTQMKIVLSLPFIEQVFLGFDPDSAGVKATEKARKMLKNCGLSVIELFIPVGKDLGNIEKGEFIEYNNKLIK